MSRRVNARERVLTHLRTYATRSQEQHGPLRISFPSRRAPVRDESRSRHNTLRFRHERTRRHPGRDPVVVRARARARACQSIIRIGLLKFLATDGERMDIHSFGPALTKAVERTRPFDPAVPATCIRCVWTYACRQGARTTK